MKLPKLQRIWSKRGIIINCTCTPEESESLKIQRETIIFVATWQMNGASIECAATDYDTGDINAFKYSNTNFAMLTVESEGASETENSSFTRPESTTSASETDNSHSSSFPDTMLSWIMPSLTLIFSLCNIHS